MRCVDRFEVEVNLLVPELIIAVMLTRILRVERIQMIGVRAAVLVFDDVVRFVVLMLEVRLNDPNGTRRRLRTTAFIAHGAPFFGSLAVRALCAPCARR